ncbi:integral peroxisomal membrane peroxin-domain-containing protein [Mucidula mucida]|nr:integral peroxisomal membrane peroxin-domain-containing protein [Mucidula mucida]
MTETEAITGEWLRTSPTPLVAALLRVGPIVRVVRRCAQVASWRAGNWYSSWLALAGWWAFCLGARVTIIGALAILALFVSPPLPAPQKPLGTEDALQRTVDDILLLSSLLPQVALPHTLTVRAGVVLYVVWLAIGFIVPGRILLGVGGTLLLCWRAPWFGYITGTLWRSAWVRWAIYSLWSRISGRPLPVTTHFTPSSVSSSSSPDRFLFTIYENQRWWMGLDWTAALLPNERPSWCSSSLAPVQPPAAFPLPPGWVWEEPEWSVIVHTEEGAAPTREVRSLPSEDEGLLAKAAGRVKHERAATIQVDDPKPTEQDEDDSEEELTDADGWVYGDNKWEAKGPKGGIGKYTRFRRWSRIALISNDPPVTDLAESSSPARSTALPDTVSKH